MAHPKFSPTPSVLDLLTPEFVLSNPKGKFHPAMGTIVHTLYNDTKQASIIACNQGKIHNHISPTPKFSVIFCLHNLRQTIPK